MRVSPRSSGLVEVPTSVEQTAASPVTSELRLPARASALGATRNYVGQAAAAFGLDAEGCDELVFAANEAVTNAIRHGAPDEQGYIHLAIAVQADRLTFVVRDYGAFVPSITKNSSRSEHGRGFALMARLVDEVQLSSEPGNTTVRLSKARA
jgi:stage II sporulation protein AB (anti-sigma F factor)